jgi:hypothetical protein
MNAYNLERFIERLDAWGISDVLLPFLLVFIIFFGILQKSKVLGERKGVNVGVAAVIAAIPVMLHVTNSFPGDYDVVDMMNDAIPGVALVALAMISFIFLLAIFGGKTDKFNYASIGTWTGALILLFIINTTWYNNEEFSFTISMIVLVSLIILTFKTGFPGLYDIVVVTATCFVLYFFGRSVGWFSEVPKWINNPNYIGFASVIVIFALIIGFALRPESNESK